MALRKVHFRSGRYFRQESTAVAVGHTSKARGHFSITQLDFSDRHGEWMPNPLNRLQSDRTDGARCWLVACFVEGCCN